MEITSMDVDEVPQDTNVFILECQSMPGGGQRALVTLGDPAKGHAGGWLTAVSPNGKQYLRGGTSFVRPNPVVDETDGEAIDTIEETLSA